MPREKRVHRNQEMFRRVNERIAELEAQWGGEDNLHVICECKEVGCSEQLVLSVEEYERIRNHAGWLIVKQGHADTRDEVIVERHGAYDVVEAHGGAPGTVVPDTNGACM